MADVLLVLIVLAFFGLCVLYVRGCERIIRSDDIGKPTTEPTREAAPTS